MPKNGITEKLAKRAAHESEAALDKAYNDMFGLPTRIEGVVKLQIRNLHHYKNDPFKDRSGEEMEKLAASIRENGLQYPIIVRPIEQKGHYEILAGRRRVGAEKLNGKTEIDAFIRNVNDDEAAMIVTETNLRSREKIFPSERAFAYKLQLEAIKRQGKRTDLEDETSAQIAQKFSRDVIAEKNGVSKDEIRRYIRLTHLISPLLDLVDVDKIPFVAAVDLSYLDEPSQTNVHTFFFKNEHGVKLDLKLAVLFRDTFKEKGKLADEDIETLCHKNQSNVQLRTFSINRKKLSPYLGNIPDDTELERLFIEFLEARFRKHS